MAKVFKNGKWIEEESEPSPVPAIKPGKVFKDGKWTDGEEIEEAKVLFVDPRDIEPQPPRSPVNDHDRPRWVAENVRYLEQLSNFRARQQFKAEHPELKGKSWHVATE